MVEASDFKKGMRILVGGEPYIIVDFSHAKMGRGRPHTKARMKHMISGAVFEKSYLSNEKFHQPDTQHRKMEYLYNDGDDYHFMDCSTFEQTVMTVEYLGDDRYYLMENKEYTVLFLENNPISVDLPASVVLKVVESEPAIKGDSVTNIQKPAKLETGLMVKVPLFVKEGDKVKVDTRTGQYLERSNK